MTKPGGAPAAALTPEEAVNIMRSSVEAGTGVGPQVAAGALAHIDQQAAQIVLLQATITNNEQYQTGHLAGYQVGYADGAATVPPNLPTQPPPDLEDRARRLIVKVKTYVQQNAKPARNATGAVVEVAGLRGLLKDQETEPPPPA